MSQKHHKHRKNEKDMDMRDPRMDKHMKQKHDSPVDRQAEGSMDGPHLIDPTEQSNRSMDEGKVYDL